MQIKVFNKLDLSRPIDQANIDNCNITIHDLLNSVTGKFNEKAFENIDVYADGIQIPKQMWGLMSLNQTKNLHFIINPNDAFTIAAVIIAIVAAVVSFVMMGKIKTPKQDNTSSQSSSIYDPNAQGNKVKLEDPIPEQFGYVKAFPDLISDYHYFYRNNQRYMSVLLCQGVGYFDHSRDRMFIGNTPFTDFNETLLKCNVYEPGQDCSDHEAHICWYSSTEVTSSGHEIVPSKNGESTDTEKITFCPKFEGNILKSYKSDRVITGVDSTGVHGKEVLKPYVLKYDVDNIFKITDCDPLINLDVLNTNNINHLANDGSNCKVYIDEWPCKQMDKLVEYDCGFRQKGGYTITPGGVPQYIPLVNVKYIGKVTYGEDDNGKYFLVPVNALYDDRCTGYSIELYFIHCISYTEMAKGDKDSLTITDTNTVIDIASLSYYSALEIGDIVTVNYSETYQIGFGPSQHNETYSTQFRAKVEAIDDTTITLNKPIEKSIPSQAIYKSSEFTLEIVTDFDDPYRDCNGYYRVTEKIDNYTFRVEAVDGETFDYDPITNWKGFPCSGNYTCNTTLLQGANAQGGNAKPSTAGPYRACPIGAESQTYEVDIHFPGGIYRMNDNGGYEEQTARVLIEYADINSDVWASEEHSFTYATPNELGFTFRINVQPNVSLRFKVTNISEYTESSQVQMRMVWNGLKCVIAQPTSYEDVTVIALTVKGDETLSESNENQISTFWTRKLPEGNTGRLSATRDVVPAIAYICQNSRYKDLYNSSSWTEYRQDMYNSGIQFNFRFDEKTTILEALRDVLQVGYAEPIVIGNEIVPKRKKPTDEIVQMFTPSNMSEAPKIDIQLITEDTDNEINISYMDGIEEQENATLHGDNVTWKDTEIFVDLDPKTNVATWQIYQNSDNVQSVKALTLTSRDSAFRLAAHKLRESMYCRTKYSFQTEMDGLNCQYGDVVLLALPQSIKTWWGNITEYKDNVITVNKKLKADDVNGIIYLRKPDGSTTSSECVYIDEKHVLLTSTQDWLNDWLDNKSSAQELPYFAFGELVKCWITSIKPQNNKCTIECVNYDERIFADDPF